MGIFSRAGKAYTGPVVFVDGTHYAVKNGKATRQRVTASGEGYVFAGRSDPKHNDVYGGTIAEVRPE